MSLSDLMLTVYDTFRQNKTRFILTISGITLGVALLILMSSFLRSGADALMKAQQEAVGSNILTVTTRPVPLKDRKKTTRELAERDAHILSESSLFGPTQISGERRKTLQATYGNKTHQISLTGLSMDAFKLYSLEMQAGRFFSDYELQRGERVCILGDEVAHSFFGSTPLEPGDVVEMNGSLFRVIGILSSKLFLGKTSSLDLWDRRILIPISTYGMSIEPGPALSLFSIKILGDDLDKQKLTDFRTMLITTLLRLHEGVENFAVSDPTEQDTMSIMVEVSMKVLLAGISGLALLVGGINIMNIMLITVTERTREIGIRRALGCPKRTLLQQFLLEAGVISMTGGLLGIILGIGLTAILAVILHSSWHHWRFIIDMTALLVGVFVSFGTGILFGLYPALQASRMPPDVCLRYE